MNMNKLKSIVFAFAVVGVMSVSAWTCEKCGAAIDDDYKFCDRTGCGAEKPKPKPVYTPAPAPTYTPPPTYTPQRRTMPHDEQEWYNGKLVKKTPVHIGFLGSELALPPGEYYSVYGLCTDPLVATVVNAYGLETGSLVASTYKSMYGLQIGGLATSADELMGIQIGAFNVAKTGYGMQIGVINSADTFYGVQIGAINMIKNSTVTFMPVINACF